MPRRRDDPQRDVPIGIIASLVLCTVLYIAVAAVLTGMVPYDKIDIEGAGLGRLRTGGPALGPVPGLARARSPGITSVLLVMMLSQPRVWLAMARDGLVPTSFFGAIHDKYRTPWKATILTGVFVSRGGALLPIRVLAELTNIGTLFAFVVVCAAVLIMRGKHPEAERPFRAPARALRADRGHPDLPDAHVLPGRRELVPAVRLAWPRASDLLRLRAPP